MIPRRAYIQQFIFRVPKKNYEEMMSIQNQLNEFFSKYDILNRDVFLLHNTEDVKGFVNLSNFVSAGADEEVLVVLAFYKDRSHRDDLVTKIRNDEKYRLILKRFSELITPESSIITGEFGSLNEQILNSSRQD